MNHPTAYDPHSEPDDAIDIDKAFEACAAEMREDFIGSAKSGLRVPLYAHGRLSNWFEIVHDYFAEGDGAKNFEAAMTVIGKCAEGKHPSAAHWLAVDLIDKAATYYVAAHCETAFPMWLNDQQEGEV